jgi:hypothetical protein
VAAVVRMIAASCAVVVSLTACGTKGSVPVPVETQTSTSSVGATAPASATTPSFRVRMPAADADGNPPCPAPTSWGADASGGGITVTYWGKGAEHVTVIARTNSGTDYAQSADLRSDQQFRLFDFPDVDHAQVNGILIVTNTRRCFAIPDPATARQ